MASKTTANTDRDGCELILVHSVDPSHGYQVVWLTADLWNTEERRTAYWWQEPLRGFAIRAQQDSQEHTFRGMYAMEAGYRDAEIITAERAGQVLTTLRRLETAMARYAEEWGPAPSYGQYVLRICKALGIGTILWERYSTNPELLTVAEAAARIDREVIDWQVAHPAAAA